MSTLSRWWRDASGGEKILVVLAVLTLLIGVPAAVRALQSSSDKASAGGASSVGAPPPGTTSDGTATTGGEGSGGAHPVFLKQLHPSGGDTPQIGDAELDGRSFRHSIFYEEIGEPSRTGPCKEMTNCRATFYELGGGYETFTASFGLFAHGSSAAGFLPTAEWWVKVDGESLDLNRDVVANTPPEPVSVGLNGGQVLELWVKVEEPGIGESNTAVWGNAHLR